MDEFVDPRCAVSRVLSTKARGVKGQAGWGLEPPGLVEDVPSNWNKINFKVLSNIQIFLLNRVIFTLRKVD